MHVTLALKSRRCQTQKSLYQALTEHSRPVNRSRNKSEIRTTRAERRRPRRSTTTPNGSRKNPPRLTAGEKGREREHLLPLQTQGARRPWHRERGRPLHRPHRAGGPRRADGLDGLLCPRTQVPGGHGLGRSSLRSQLQPVRAGHPLVLLRPRRHVRAARDHHPGRRRQGVQVARAELCLEQGRQDRSR